MLFFKRHEAGTKGLKSHTKTPHISILMKSCGVFCILIPSFEKYPYVKHQLTKHDGKRLGITL